ncbi:hypothetical protein MPER_05535, partial [Moniliophthora perniciosa FA553]
MPSSILILLVVTAFLGWFLANKLKQNPNLPPGPTAEPLLGHLRLIPSQGQAEAFHQWAKIYGDVMYLRVFGRDMVVLDSFEAAQELLEKRGAKYSCRPRFVIYE